MIICFLKKPEEIDAKCYIEKFIDRIWFDEDGNALVLRTIILRVNSDSQQTVSGFCILADRKLSDNHISDISHTGLDESFYWNQRESEPLKITDAANGVIVYDGLANIWVPKRNKIKTIPFGRFSILELSFNQTFKKDEGIFIRLKMNVPVFARKLPNGDLNFGVKYLSSEGEKHVLNQLDLTHREIEVLSIVDETTKLGGFDVFLTPPQGTQITTVSVSPNMLGRTSKDADGNDIVPRFNTYWRLRLETRGKVLKKTDSGMSVAGAAIKDDLAERVKRHQRRSIALHTIAILIGLIALLVALCRK